MKKPLKLGVNTCSKSKDTFMNLKELLLESGPSRVLYHFTSIERLQDILKDGFLEGKPYEVSSTSKDFENCMKSDSPNELCLIRQSMARNIKGVSVKPPEVRFVFQIDKLRDSVRGLKVKSIAEYPKKYIKNVRLILKTRISEKNDKEIDALARKVIRDAENFRNQRGKVYKEVKSGLNKAHDQVWTKLSLQRLITALEDIVYSQKRREGEERVVADKIPLNKKYMSIEIVAKGPYYYGKGGAISGTKEISALMKKWDHLFVKNKEYETFIDYLKLQNK